MIFRKTRQKITQPAGKTAAKDADDADRKHDFGDLIIGQACGLEEQSAESQSSEGEASEETLDNQDGESGCARQERPESLELREDDILAFTHDVLRGHWCKGHGQTTNDHETPFPTPETTASAVRGVGAV